MKIKVIGKNSSNRTKLLKHLERVIKKEENSFSYEVELLEGDEYLRKYGITSTPAFIINDKMISQGKILTEREIKNYIRLLT